MNIKLIQAQCIQCRKTYKSEGLERDGGECFSCRSSFVQKMVTKIGAGKFKIYELKKAKPENKRVLPKNLDPILDRKIMEFFCANYQKLFRTKIEAYKFVNEEFGTDFTQSEVTAICIFTRLSRAGLSYNHRVRGKT